MAEAQNHLERQRLEEAYVAGREELAAALQRVLQGNAEAGAAIRSVLWDHAWCGADRRLNFFYGPTPDAWRQTVVGFDPVEEPAVERAGGQHLRLRVTTNWALDLARYRDLDGWFEALSPKKRKNLRWLRNSYPKLGVRFEPIRDEAAFRRFEKLYAAQFDGYQIGSDYSNGLRDLYLELERRGMNFSHLVVDQAGNDVAACLGYIHHRAFNFSHLTRQDRSPLDKYSPGFYLVFWTIEALYRDRTADWFFFGPGEYDYKPACLGEPFPVYRYERLTPLNLGGLIKLWNRGRKERRRWCQAHRDEDGNTGNS